MSRRSPRYDHTPDDLLRHHGDALSACLGQTIDGTWVAWDTREDCWLPDEAVILRIGSQNLEIVCWQLDGISLSWDAIDLTSKPAWVTDWGSEFSLEWRRDPLPDLKAVVGSVVRGMNVLEYRYRTTVVSARDAPETVGRQYESWLLHGLELELGGLTLSVFNALDESGVTLAPSEGPDFRRTPVRGSA